jgi:hypothetical protein
MVQSHFPGRGWTLFSLKHPVPLWGPPSLLYGVYRGSYPGVKVWGLNFTHSPPSRPTFTSPGYLYVVLNDNFYLYLQYFHDTHRANGNRAFIHDTDIDLRESSTVSIATKLWTGQSGVRFPVGERDFAVLQNVQTSPRAHPALFSGYQG